MQIILFISSYGSNLFYFFNLDTQISISSSLELLHLGVTLSIKYKINELNKPK